MSNFVLPPTCAQFEAHVSGYVDGALSPSDRADMGTHLSQCATCAALHADVSAIVASAASLPVLSPSHDLWSGIANRLDTPVVSISSTTGVIFAERNPLVSFRILAAAAMLIVAVSSGATYWLTRANPVVQPTTSGVATTAPAVPVAAAPQVAAPGVVSPSTVAAASPQRAITENAAPDERTPSRYASNDGSVELVYEREITAMRRIVDERLGDLDSSTVVEIERNLRIIDKAIEDSRRALQNDPRSRFLSSQLDRALESKLGILRRLALL